MFDPCLANVECVNTEGSFVCGSCLPGYVEQPNGTCTGKQAEIISAHNAVNSTYYRAQLEPRPLCGNLFLEKAVKASWKLCMDHENIFFFSEPQMLMSVQILTFVLSTAYAVTLLATSRACAHQDLKGNHCKLAAQVSSYLVKLSELPL